MKKAILFLIPFLITIIAVVGYFKLTQKISTISIPTLPNISFSDLVKVSRFSLDRAPIDSLLGKINEFGGTVKFESRIATESATLTDSSLELQQGMSLYTGKDGHISFQIPTLENLAMTINMSNNASLGIIQTLPADVVFSQTSGVVEYKKLADIPVTIRSLHLLVENNGDITVTLDGAAPFVTVAVNSGSAIVAYNNINDVSRMWTVNAGQKLTFNDYYRRVVIKK